MKKVLFLLLLISTLFTSCVEFMYVPRHPGYHLHSHYNTGRVYYRGNYYQRFPAPVIRKQQPPRRDDKEKREVERPRRSH